MQHIVECVVHTYVHLARKQSVCEYVSGGGGSFLLLSCFILYHASHIAVLPVLKVDAYDSLVELCIECRIVNDSLFAPPFHTSAIARAEVFRNSCM